MLDLFVIVPTWAAVLAVALASFCVAFLLASFVTRRQGLFGVLLILLGIVAIIGGLYFSQVLWYGAPPWLRIGLLYGSLMLGFILALRGEAYINEQVKAREKIRELKAE